ncbi:MAG: hypothetical protein GC201_06115 [Alphaproteobacteria bacterium]|nr:hypothetical protein [Alphaproteobacteria bacterium]
MSRTILILTVLLVLSVSVNLFLWVEASSGVPFSHGLSVENHAIDNITSLVTAVGAVVGAIGLVVGADQLRQTRNQARAQAVYTALKDVRESTSTDVGHRFNLYYALHEQRRLGVFSDEMWEPVRMDIAVTMKADEAKTYWASRKANFPRDFQAEVDAIARSA